MPMSAGCSSSLVHLFQSIRQVLVDLSRLLLLTTKSRSALAAENLFLRKQLALFQERQVRPHLATDATRWAPRLPGQVLRMAKGPRPGQADRKSTRLNSSHSQIS